MSRKTWHKTDVIASRHAREAIEYGLMEAGALGTETTDAAEDVRITGYFESPVDEDHVRETLVDALRIYNLARAGLSELRSETVPDRDWLAEWKKNWQPVAVGRFIVAPPWSEPRPVGVTGGLINDSIIIRINPGMAFGTGTHETTRLCLQAIENHFRGGSFLDVGTGTGILAIAAARIFPEARIEACDTDADAIEIAKENACLNQVADRIEFRAGSIDEETASADLVCANLTAPVIADLLPTLLAITCGRLVLSGILDSQVEMIQTRLSDLGSTIGEIDQNGEWVALVV